MVAAPSKPAFTALQIDQFLAALAAHLDRYGHLFLSPRRVTPPVDQWAAKQRQRWYRNQLDRVTEQKLRQLGFPLEGDDCEWEHGFARVVTSVKRTRRSPAADSLAGKWLVAQRELARDGRLSSARRRRLQAISVL